MSSNLPATKELRYVECGTSSLQWKVTHPASPAVSPFETSLPLETTRLPSGTVISVSEVALSFGWSWHGYQYLENSGSPCVQAWIGFSGNFSSGKMKYTPCLGSAEYSTLRSCEATLRGRGRL